MFGGREGEGGTGGEVEAGGEGEIAAVLAAGWLTRSPGSAFVELSHEGCRGSVAACLSRRGDTAGL